jgi:hypothetical protein
MGGAAPHAKKGLAEQERAFQNYCTAEGWYLAAFKEFVEGAEREARECLCWLMVTSCYQPSALDPAVLNEARLFALDPQVQTLHTITSALKANDFSTYDRCMAEADSQQEWMKVLA